MLCIDVIEPGYPVLHLHESTIGDMLALHEERDCSSFPVLDNDEPTGILSLKDVFHLPEETKTDELQHLFTKAAVPENEFFYSALRVMNLTGNIVPVTDTNNKYRGTVSQRSMLDALNIFLNVPSGNGGVIVLEMGKTDYAFSEIARLVESCEAGIVQLTTYFDVKTELFVVTLKADRNDISEIVSTLQRHDYHITYYFGEEKYENEIKRNYDALMNYLSI